jgi:hypothetical protein
MATSVTSAPSQVTSSSSSITAQTRTSYLNRCVEDLSPDKVAHFEKKVQHWDTISIVSTVAFFALAIGAFIAASILAPVYAPFVGIGAILLALPASQKIKQFQEWSQAAQNEADKYKEIQRNYTDLTGQTPQELQRILLSIGIIWIQIPGIEVQHPEYLSRLNPLLARAKYLEKQTEYWIHLRDQHANEARLLQTDTTDSTKDKKAIARHLALKCEDDAMNFKIQSAFVNAVLRKSDFCGTLEDLGTLSKCNYEDRALGNALNDPTVNQILTFNNRNLAPITFNDLKTLSVADLGQRIFAAMAA